MNACYIRLLNARVEYSKSGDLLDKCSDEIAGCLESDGAGILKD